MFAYFVLLLLPLDVFLLIKKMLYRGFSWQWVCVRSRVFLLGEVNLIKQIAAIFSFQFSTRETKRDFYVKSANTRKVISSFSSFSFYGFFFSPFSSPKLIVSLDFWLHRVTRLSTRVYLVRLSVCATWHESERFSLHSSMLKRKINFQTLIHGSFEAKCFIQ